MRHNVQLPAKNNTFFKDKQKFLVKKLLISPLEVFVDYNKLHEITMNCQLLNAFPIRNLEKSAALFVFLFCILKYNDQK